MDMAMELVKRGADIAIANLVARSIPVQKSSSGTPTRRWVEEKTYSSPPYYGEDIHFGIQSMAGRETEPWVLTLLAGVAAMGIVFIILLKYTVSLLITLASVEEPAPVYLPVESEDTSDIYSPKSDAARADGHPPRGYITSSIRGTLRHLRSEAGFFSAWRGLSAYLALCMANILFRTCIFGLFQGDLSPLLTRIMASVLVPVCLARLNMVCTHIMISKPQNVMWLTRLWATPWSLACRTIPALVICNLASQLITEFSVAVTFRISDNPWINLAFIAVDICLFLLIVFPANIALIRVQASLLPDDQESIVPFDRTFGKADGQIGITFAEAWRSIGRDGWKRISKLFAKTYIPAFLLTIAVGGFALYTWFLIMKFFIHS